MVFAQLVGTGHGIATWRYFGAELDKIPLIFLLLIFYAYDAGRTWGLDGAWHRLSETRLFLPLPLFLLSTFFRGDSKGMLLKASLLSSARLPPAVLPDFLRGCWQRNRRPAAPHRHPRRPRLLDVKTGNMLTNQAIVIEGDKIVSLGPSIDERYRLTRKPSTFLMPPCFPD